MKKLQSMGTVNLSEIDEEESSFGDKVDLVKRQATTPFRKSFVERGGFVDVGIDDSRRQTCAKYAIEDEDIEEIIMKMYKTDASNQNSY